jgi:GNAT superfamily N-acetyltransferase
MGYTIRDAEAGDEKEWRRLWAAYLDFYDVTLDPEITESTWRRILDPESPIKMRVAATPGGLLGFAVYLPHPSTWVKNMDCYLEDLYIDENLRGQGIGRALIDDLIELCKANGWERLYWHTDEENSRARKLYDSYVKTDGHVRYRMKING